MTRPVALTIPVVTVCSRPNGLPIAITGSPTSRRPESPSGTTGNPDPSGLARAAAADALGAAVDDGRLHRPSELHPGRRLRHARRDRGRSFRPESGPVRDAERGTKHETDGDSDHRDTGPRPASPASMNESVHDVALLKP